MSSPSSASISAATEPAAPSPLPGESSDETVRLATETLTRNRVAVFIVAYNAERYVENVLSRIPAWVATRLAEVFVIDDSSKDATVDRAVAVEWSAANAPLRVYRTPYNQGYGGNQRLGYLYAIERGLDIVVLLHGDGQYAPEFLPQILAEYSRPGGADAVFGSRFMTRWGALRGRMPLYKFVGNRILTGIQNRVLGTRMSEMHSGYRSYRVAALREIPFHANSLGFDFDSDIIIQLVAAGMTIREVAIPTYYGDEISHVNGMKYAWACVRGACQYRLMELELFYDVRFDIPRRARRYTAKQARTSLHHHMRQVALPPGSELLDFGGGDGSAVGLAHAARGVSVTALDVAEPVADEMGQQAARHPRIRRLSADLDSGWTKAVSDRRFRTVFALDVLEHLRSPETAAKQIFDVMEPGGKLYASTGNIAFWVSRGMHVLGQFNYGRRGILDLTHRRLFTVSSFRRLVRNAGFRIDSVRCFGPPIADLAGRRSRVFAFLDRVSGALARVWKGMFGYQILIEATRPDAVDSLMSHTFLDLRERGAASEKR
jgi:glycosyltransferase involved in cell wall biosynthesis